LIFTFVVVVVVVVAAENQTVYGLSLVIYFSFKLRDIFLKDFKKMVFVIGNLVIGICNWQILIVTQSHGIKLVHNVYYKIISSLIICTFNCNVWI